MWRMNSIAIFLVLCTLLLSNDVVGQEDADAGASDPETNDSNVTPPVMDSAQPGITIAPDFAVFSQNPPAVNTTLLVYSSPSPDNQEGGASGTTAGPSSSIDVIVNTLDFIDVLEKKPVVQCVGKEEIEESKAVKAVVTTNDCETIKKIIEESGIRCFTENCDIKVFQEGQSLQMISKDVKPNVVLEALKGELKEKLGVTKVEEPSSSSSGRSVFVGILISGLLVAAAIVAAYCKCQRRPHSKGVKLAEEGYPVDQQNQGNTLVSVAPLIPQTETEEKPTVNGESPEAAKTESPPTNGHSATKTADTEL
ncbi:uncharacterized protein LOC144071752 [Stigmatopora argus]